jgi:selenocysteine lyase/cysteine desulfurase
MAGTAAAVDYFAWIGENLAKGYQPKYAHYQGRRKYVHAALDYLFAYESELALHLIDGLQALPGVRIQGITAKDAIDRRVPTVAFTIDGASPANIAGMLAQQNIFVWSGHNYAVEVVKALGIYESGGTVRVGPVHYNNADEIDRLLIALDEILPKARAA